MNRRNFTRAIKVEIIKRSIIAKVPTCEAIENGARCPCQSGLSVHHLKMDALELDEEKAGRKLTAGDGQLLCKRHHDPITQEQRGVLKKILRVEAKHLGATKPKGQIQSPGFPKAAKEARISSKPPLPPRALYR